MAHGNRKSCSRSTVKTPQAGQTSAEPPRQDIPRGWRRLRAATEKAIFRSLEQLKRHPAPA
jgi:hypothetical protein